jgi:molecular chaperone IbpA
MTRFDVAKFFDMPNFDKYFVGFEPMMKKFEEAHESLAKAIPNYPPYNIVKVDDNKYVIEMAVAGFGKHQLDMTLEDGTLVISGNSALNNETEHAQEFLFKGIADRAFTRKFSLADTVEIKNAELINGMLKIWLENIIPDSKKSKKIDITDTATENKPTDKQLLNERK